jgi:hypothetical protein
MKFNKKILIGVCLVILFLFVIDTIDDTIKNITGPNLNKTSTIIIDKNKVTIKDEKGKTTDKYIPPGGTVTVKKEKDPKNPNKEIVTTIIKDWGFSKDIGLGLNYSGKILPQIDLRFFFWKRYSVCLGVNLEYPNLGVYRHIDDIIRFQNIEVGVNYGKGFDGLNRMGTAIRVSL